MEAKSSGVERARRIGLTYRSQQTFTERDETLADGRGALGECALVALVFSTAFGGLDANRREAEPREIIRAGAHVHFADFACQLEKCIHFYRRSANQVAAQFFNLWLGHQTDPRCPIDHPHALGD